MAAMSVVLPACARIASPPRVDATQPIADRSSAIPVGTVPACIVAMAAGETTARPAYRPSSSCAMRNRPRSSALAAMNPAGTRSGRSIGAAVADSPNHSRWACVRPSAIAVARSVDAWVMSSGAKTWART